MLAIVKPQFKVPLHDKHRRLLLYVLTTSRKKYTLAAGQQLGMSEAVGVPMIDTWISPWSGEQLTADELIREVALDALSQIYLVSLLGFPEPMISIESDTVIVKSSAIGYEYDIPYPRVLLERMSEGFADALQSLKQEYRIHDCANGAGARQGEKIGAVLHYFRTLERLIRIVAALHCWNKQLVLAVHGLPDDYTPETLKCEIESAGFHYLVMCPAEGVAGSGCFKAISMPEAIALVNRLWPRQPGVVESFFDLERNYGQHTWISDDNTWSVGASVEKSGGYRTN